MFSSRVPDELTPSDLFLAFEKKQGSVADLTITNPLRCEIPYPPDLLKRLTHRDVLSYEPDSQGLLPARQAVSREFLRQDLPIPDVNIFLTSGTSEAYSFLFKILVPVSLKSVSDSVD